MAKFRTPETRSVFEFEQLIPFFTETKRHKHLSLVIGHKRIDATVGGGEEYSFKPISQG